MRVTEIVDFVQQKAEEFGAKPPQHSKPSYRLRVNLKSPFDVNEAYFGFVLPGEEQQGGYRDFSLAVMPSEDERPWFVNICVGTMGFQNDHELATRPGLRRMFQQLVNSDGFCKSDFADVETPLPNSIRDRNDLAHLYGALDKYSKVFCAGQVVTDPYEESGKKIIAAFVAGYARMRKWPTNQAHRKAVNDALSDFMHVPADPSLEVKELIENRRFVILEGAPGTGKTRLAKQLAAELNAKAFFTQFHAETTYSDFVHGILPSLEGDKLGYSQKIGVLAESITYATRNPNEKVLLIVDEINRANLANVLGPLFYLFEPHMDEVEGVQISVTPDLVLSALPSNFYFVGTMNSADRSLAVVDFALRRRFAWYRMSPRPITDDDGEYIEGFFGDEFESISRIFDWHATHDELSLQPGQAYFLADSIVQMNQRIRYELLPLIREYLQEGRMRSAKEDLNKFFLDKIGQPIYE